MHGGIRFDYFENVISKHHLKKCSWTQAAQWGFLNHTNNLGKYSIARVKQIDADTVEIIKRKDQNKTFLFNTGIFDQKEIYERVIINRKDNTVAVDRLDANWWIPEPFLAQRDLFYPEGDSGKLAFIRHNYWLHKVQKVNCVLWSNLSASSYASAFKKVQV